MYTKTNWQDEVVDSDTGETIQQGTLQSAKNFNNMENGIDDASIASAILIRELAENIHNESVDEYDVTLENKAKFPFNDSGKTIALKNAKSRNDYTVEAVAENDNGTVGDIVVYDKLLNGFKVKYTGSKKSATLKLFVKGGE